MSTQEDSTALLACADSIMGATKVNQMEANKP